MGPSCVRDRDDAVWFDIQSSDAWAVQDVVTMNTAAIRVGRLLEIRAFSFRNVPETTALFQTIGAELARVPLSTRVVAVTDWRYCPVMAGDAAEYALARMTKNNPRLLRSGALASRDSSIAGLQFVRLVRESKLESRRLFFDEEELKRWLGEVLTDPEKARLHDFLREPIEPPRKTPGLGAPPLVGAATTSDPSPVAQAPKSGPRRDRNR